MRTLLIVTKQPSMASAIEAALEAGKFQIIAKEEVADAEFLLARGAIDAVILDVELTDVRAIRAIDEVKTFAPGCPAIVYAGAKQWEWEEEAYLHGVEHVLTKPVRGKLLMALLLRLFPVADAKPPPGSPLDAPGEAPKARPGAEHPVRALEALRRFSGVLADTLDAASLLKQFLLLLREVIGVNRAIIFLRKPASLLGNSPLAPEDRWLRSSCAIGLDQNVLQHFALSLSAGIGGFLHRQGRILRAGNPEAQSNHEIAKEFRLLGGQVAIPILDRQSLIGVVIFDERLTGEPYGNDELALIFHMLEEVGLAVRNAWLYGQAQANHGMLADILGNLGSACLVIDSNLSILHANAAASRLLLHDRPGKTQVEFSDLPQQLGSLVFTVVKTGVSSNSFKHQFSHTPERWHRITITPFSRQGGPPASAALLIIDDITEHERVQRLEIETANLKLVNSMAEHLAHEIGNALVPLSTHQQLMGDSIDDKEFQESLTNAISGAVKRISRLSSQMNFLARSWSGEFSETVQVSDLIVEAFHDAHAFHPGKKVAQLSFDKSVAPPLKVSGDPKALRHAFAEIILNALQANPEAPGVYVSIQQRQNDKRELQIDIRDTGKGFSPESVQRVMEPFYSTRNVGLGIGLTVSRKIIESHHGRIEFPTASGGAAGIVRIVLPVQN